MHSSPDPKLKSVREFIWYPTTQYSRFKHLFNRKAARTINTDVVNLIGHGNCTGTVYTAA